MKAGFGLRGLCAAVLTVWLAGCGDRRAPELSSEVADRAERRAELHQKLTGTWMRPVRTADSLREGLRLDADGRFGLIGIHTMHGCQWLVRSDTLVLTTSSQNYAQPEESRLWIRALDFDSLVLSAEPGYISGTYVREENAARRVTGSVNYRLDVPSGPDAALFLELRTTTGDTAGTYLASQTLSVMGKHAPVPFHIYYAASDAAGADSGLLLVTLVVDGVPRLNLEPALKVDLKADAEGVDVWLDSPES